MYTHMYINLMHHGNHQNTIMHRETLNTKKYNYKSKY